MAVVEPDVIDVHAYVGAQNTAVMAYAADMYLELTDMIEALEDLKSTYTTTSLTDIFSEDIPVTGVVSPTVGDFPAQPDDPTIVYTAPTAPVAPTVDAIVIPTLPDIPTTTIPTFSGSFDYTNSSYVTTDLETFRARLVDFVTNGGTGIGAAVEAAIYARDTARAAVEQTKLLTDVQNYHEARGFTNVNAQYLASVNNVTAENARQNQILSNEIMIKAAELEQENMRIAQTALVQVDTLLVDIHTQEEARLLTAETSEIDALAKVFDVEVRAELSKLELHKLTIESLVAFIEANVKAAVAPIDIYVAQAGAYSEEVKAEYTRVTAVADVYKSKVTAVTGLMRETVAKAVAEADVYRTKSTHHTDYLGKVVQNDANNIEMLSVNMSADIEKLKAAAQVSAQIVASALTSMNTSASIGQSVNQNFSHSNDETKGDASGLATFVYHTVDTLPT